jgi:hypothetical protein
MYLCENGIYHEIFNELLNKGYDLGNIDLSHCFTDRKDIPAKKGEKLVIMDLRGKRSKIKRFSRCKRLSSLLLFLLQTEMTQLFIFLHLKISSKKTQMKAC